MVGLFEPEKLIHRMMHLSFGITVVLAIIILRTSPLIKSSDLDLQGMCVHKCCTMCWFKMIIIYCFISELMKYLEQCLVK